MHLQPSPFLYVYAVDASAPVRLLRDDGEADPSLSNERTRLLAYLASVIHASAWRLDETGLRTLEQFISLQRWPRE